MNSTPAPVIAIDNLALRRGRRDILSGVTLAADAGDVLALIGPNGSGKSSTLACLLGLVPFHGGTARILGVPYASLERTGAVGVCLDGSVFNPHMTGHQALEIHASAHGLRGPDARERIVDVLGIVSLRGGAERRRVGTYSYGMRRRLGLAAALLPGPDVLVLDEPGNGLDPDGIRWLRDLVRDFAARGGAVLMTSHQLPEVRQCASHVALLDGGRVVDSAPIKEVGDLEAYYVGRPSAAS